MRGVCLPWLFHALGLFRVKLPLLGQNVRQSPPTSSLLNLITVSFFPLLFVCLGDNHRKSCDSLWHHSCLQFHFLYLCKSPDTLVREYFAAKRISPCAFGLQTTFCMSFHNLFILGRVGSRVGKLPIFWLIYRGFWQIFHEKHKSLHMLGIKPKSPFLFEHKWQALSLTPMVSKALIFSCFTSVLRDIYISQTWIICNFSDPFLLGKE